MSLLVPLGLLGLLGVAVLILIYILKPNYQQKMVSSTFVWKLSLKYKKKRLPINKFRNILILICQILILTLCAIILATPVIRAIVPVKKTEKIVIIDASAGMLAEQGGETRFERAVIEVKQLAVETYNMDGVLSVILAGSEASYVAQRAGSASKQDVLTSLDDLIVPDDMKCSYGRGDINGAVALAEELMNENPDAEILLYTATTYIDSGSITLVDMAERDSEWNAAILNCTAELVDNSYAFKVEVACYGRDTDVLLCMELSDVNEGTAATNPVRLTQPIRCEGNETVTYTFNTENSSEQVYSYSQARFYLEGVDDSYSYDNTFYLYDGLKQTVRIQYASSLPNSFFYAVLSSLCDGMRQYWNVELTEVKENEAPALEGFDIYLFEHSMPTELPTDGVVILVDMDKAPEGSGLHLGDEKNGDFKLAAGETHPLTAYMTPENINMTRYRRVMSADGYTSLLYCGGDPVLLVKDEPDQKIVALTVNVNRSDLALRPDLPILVVNIFNYFIPSTVKSAVAEIGEKVELKARSESLLVNGPGLKVDLPVLPAEWVFTQPGTYTMTQTLLSGVDVIESLYVRIPADESNIFKEEDLLNSPYVQEQELPSDLDLMFYFAIAMVALLFAEWWLQSREQF